MRTDRGTQIAFLIGRLMVGGMYLNAGIANLLELNSKAGYAASKGLPDPKTWVTVASLLLIVAGFSLITGIRPQIGVGAVTLFLIPVTLIMHNFWALEGVQQISEMRSFLDFIASEPPETVLEIGTGRGGTLFLLARAARENALLVSLNAPNDDRFGARPEYAARARLYQSLGRRTQRVVFLAADSHLPETLAQVRQILAGRLVDVLFVDGDHTFDGVASDFRMYAPLVRSGGVVAFHDIVPGPAENVGGVPEFWKSVRAPDSVEFVEDWDQGAYGIGVLRR